MSPVPTMKGTIERRLLINYRADPGVVERLLPRSLKPRIVGAHAIVGICLIRLRDLRPAGFPAALGISTENAAHRIAVEWRGDGGTCRGVYIPRRDTSSLLTTLFGGRLFPGEHHRARFSIAEESGLYDVAFTSLDGSASVAVTAKTARELPSRSAFASLQELSDFFRDSPLGYSATRKPGVCEGLELRCERWEVAPLDVVHVHSSFFEDLTIFPRDSLEFDSGLVMQGIPASWHASGMLALRRDGPRAAELPVN